MPDRSPLPPPQPPTADPAASDALGRPAGPRQGAAGGAGASIPDALAPDALDVLALDLGEAEAEAEDDRERGRLDLARDAGQRALDALRRLSRSAVDRAVLDPLDVRSASVAESLLVGAVDSSGPAAASRVVATASMVLPRLQKVLLSRSSRMAKWVPGGRVVTYSATAVAMAVSARQGARELEVLASFLVHRLRDGGHPVDPAFVRWATLTLYANPTKRPDPRNRAPLTTVARRWAIRGVRGSKHAAREARDRASAIERLDLASALAAWERVQRSRREPQRH